MFKEPVHKILDELKTSRTFDGRARWGVTHQEEIRICIALIIGIKGIPSSSVGF